MARPEGGTQGKLLGFRARWVFFVFLFLFQIYVTVSTWSGVRVEKTLPLEESACAPSKPSHTQTGSSSLLLGAVTETSQAEL